MCSEYIPKANPEEVQQLIARYACADEREHATDWPGLARALVGAARRYGMPVPLYLAQAAGFREPPPPLRLVTGGRRDSDVVSDRDRTIAPVC